MTYSTSSFKFSKTSDILFQNSSGDSGVKAQGDSLFFGPNVAQLTHNSSRRSSLFVIRRLSLCNKFTPLDPSDLIKTSFFIEAAKGYAGLFSEEHDAVESID